MAVISWKIIAYLLSVAAVSILCNSYTIAVIGSSYCHYFLYIYTYYYRDIKTKGEYKAFQHAAFLYKSIAVCHIAYIYAGPILVGRVEVDHMSLLMIMCGYVVSISATQVLGIDGTYFGIELGFLQADYKFVKSFPYNIFPHPMILGQVFALLGVYKVPWVREAWPWFCPIHIVLYLLHMTQEIYDVWNGAPWYKNASKKSA
mmetsp:Transcript_36971/g.80539  ORF Transcript_36971/g.80539 Transcript_36971/m.80539 type:complete len:202 (+) Transcript_36971:238-843(+)